MADLDADQVDQLSVSPVSEPELLVDDSEEGNGTIFTDVTEKIEPIHDDGDPNVVPPSQQAGEPTSSASEIVGNSPKSEPTEDSVNQGDSTKDSALTESLKYLECDSDVHIRTVCIQAYERRSTNTFPKEEYYAFKVVTMVGPPEQEPTEEGAEEDVAVVVPEGQKSVKKWEIWRRYTEFEQLKSFFAVVYPHIIVPPIPEKKLQGSSGIFSKIAFGEDVDFLTRRRRALEIFLVRVNRHAVLKTNVWFHKFLNDQDNWKSDMVATGYQAQAESRFKMLTQVLSSHKPDTQFLDILNYSVDLRSALESLVLNRERMNVFLVGMYKGYAHLGKSLSDMAMSETTLGDQLQSSSGLMESYACSVETYVHEEELRYLLPIKEYCAFCDSLKAVVGRQEQVQLQYDKTEDEVLNRADTLEKLEKEKSDEEKGQSGFSFKKLLKFGSQPTVDEKIATLKENMEAWEESRKEKRKKVKAFNKAALDEFEEFNTQKIADFRSVLINFAYLQVQLHKKGISAWERIKAANEPQKV